MQKDKVPAFIFNCHYNGLALIQSLGRQGIPVYALDTKKSIGTRSKYAQYVQVADPLDNERLFIDQLIELSKKVKGKPLLLPTNDHWSEAISRHKNLLSEYCVVSASDISVTELLLDKEKFAYWCMKNNVTVPKAYSIEQLNNKDFNVDYPIAIKANARRRSSDGLNSKEWASKADYLRFNICNSPSDINKYIAIAKKNNIPVFLQQLVSGRSDAMRTIGVFSNAGKVKGILYGHKVRGYPAQFGDCIVGEANAVPSWARELVTLVCKELNYTGIAEFEVMIDKKSGEKYLIEINPRSWSWVGVAPYAGVDLAWIAYKELILDEPVNKCIESCTDGNPVVFMKVLEDFQNTVFFYRYDNARDWSMGPIKWWKQYKGKKKVYAEFAKDDPLIGVYSTLSVSKGFLTKLIKLVK